MADDAPAPTPVPGVDYNALIQQIMQGGGGAIQGPAAPATPAVNTNLPVASLLGEALGGGVSPLYPMSEAQQTQAGNAALLNFGIGMLQNSSGPVRHSLGQAIASGLLGAQGSLAGVREGQGQMLDIQNKQQTMQLEKIKTLLPLLMRQQAAGMPNSLLGGGGTPGGGIGATGAPITAGDAPVLQRDPSIKVAGDQANNPGNLMYVRGQPGVSGQLPLSGGRTLAAFPDMPTGIAANANQLMLNQDQHGINTVRGMVSRWVGDPKADLGSYTADVSKALGVDPDAPVDFHNPDVLSKFIAAQRPHESGPAALNPADVTKGVGLALAARSAPPGGSRTATAPPAATTPPAPVARPTAAPVAPAGTIQGTPDTGGTQVGGPGALPGVIRPPGPLVPGDVGAIIAGMKGAGASPTTLAPGVGTSAPTAPTIAQAGPTTVTPPAQPVPQQPTQGDQPPPIGGQTWEQFLTQHMPQPTPEETATWHQAPDPQTLAEAANAKAAAAQELSAARINFGAGSKEANTANERYQTASKEVGELQRQYSQTNATTLLDWTNKQKTLLAPLFKNQQDQAQAVAEADKQRAAAIALKTQEGQQAIDLANVNAGISTSTKLQEAYNTDAQNSGKRIDDLELLRGLSDNAGTPTLLTNIKIGDRSLADIISTTGFGGKDLQDKVGAVQAFRAGILNTVRELRSGGAATGEPRSNQDLQFVQDMAPNEWQNPATRSAIISFLQQVNQRRIDMAGEISRLTATRGTNGQLMPAGEAVGQARKNLPDFVQTVPAEAMGNTPAQVQARKDWFNTNVPPHTFFRYPNGRIDLYNGPGGQ